MHAYLKLPAALLFVLSASNISCNDPSSSGQPPLSSIPFIASSGFVYSWESITTDSLGRVVSALFDSVQITVKSTTAVLDSFSGLIQLEAFSLTTGAGVMKVWYKQTGDSLLEIAYSNAGVVPPVLPKGKKFVSRIPIPLPFIVSGFQSEDVLYRPNGGRLVYRFPLSDGQSWVSFTNPWRQTRTVTGTEYVTTPAGGFHCTKIFADNVVDFNDYVSRDGLIKRTFEKMKYAVTSETGPEGNGDTVWVAMEQRLLRKY